MINVLWSLMILAAIAYAAVQGDPELVTTTLFRQAARGVQTALEVMSVIVVWFGLSRVAEQAGLLPRLGRLLSPLLRPLFPDLPRRHKAFEAMSMNIAANMLGLANAATPFGLKAMKELQGLNRHPKTITPAMTTFLVLNSACATVVPTTAIALRAAAGAENPSEVIWPAFVASTIAAAVALILDRLLRQIGRKRGADR